MTLARSALVTVDEARTFLGAEPHDDPSTELLEQIIEGLSTRISQRTGDLYTNPAGVLAKEGDPWPDELSERVYEFDPTERIVSIDYARAVAAIELSTAPGDEDSWQALGSSDYYLEPVGRPVTTSITFLTAVDLPAQGVGWDALAMHARQSGAGADTQWTEWPRAAAAAVHVRAFARVKAKFGLGTDSATVPQNVKLALLMWLQNIHKRDVAFTSETIGVASATMKMPADVEELLEGEEDIQSLVGAV